MNFQPSLTSTAGSAGSAAPVPSCVLKQHAKAERAAVYPHVERLYLHERWKLRHVRATMEEKYHFKASPQMYKKRFANWGFRKNATYQSRQGTNTSLPLTPASTTLDACAMAFFTTVNQWTSRFFQSADFKNCLASNGVWKQGPLYPPAPSCERPALLYDPERASYAFRLVARLLRDGQGILAGRLARKAFLQIEDTMLIESPAFIWNLLDIMHAILRMGQAKLFHMLLMHLLGLANLHHDCRNHPASLIPSSLVQLMRHWSAETGVGSLVLMDHMREIVERGWLLNAGYFDARLLFLYYRLMWDSTPSALPEDKLHNVHLWFPLLADQVPVVAAELQEAKSRTCIHSVLEPAACCRIEDGTDSEPPDYERIRDSTAATLRDRYSADNVSPCVRVRIIQGLLKSRIAEGRDDKTTTMTHARANSRALRLFAKIVAFATKVLAEVDMELGGNLDVAIERWRAVIALREYGQDAHDPIVIHDLGSLEALLLKKGFEEEADNVRQEALLKDGKLRREHSNSFELREARCEPSAKRQQRVENVHPIPDKAGN
ncbi:hypothetical protein N656DRAFT_782034 [Canariomyces notabilis]|uniref:Clr5 domain-containing protein n=1 Tax=Canariomyces notabilis TaxID=2074819 RepID=A0AAN6QQ50_9PEZI|nr:hypothetical protein N656DRAFT_782034 [Canariomyces arenarius]